MSVTAVNSLADSHIASRHAPCRSFLLAKLRQARRGPKRDGYRRSLSVMTAERCARCDRRLGRGAPIWRLFWLGQQSVVCFTCAPTSGPCEPLPGLVLPGPNISPERPCEFCGRRVTIVNDPRPRRRHVFCSKRCTWRAANRQTKALRAEARQSRTCETCGRPFVPRRADAKRCSPACRQAAYRRRRAQGSESP